MDIKKELELIYCEAFGTEDSEFRKFLFGNCFNSCRYLVENEKAVAELFAFECELKSNGEFIPSIYIYAAATLKSERKKGLMSSLLENVKKEFPNHFLFLRPATDSLINYYSRFGFKTIPAKSEISNNNFIIPIGDLKALTENIKPNGESFTLMYYYSKEINETINFLYSME